MIAHIGGVPLEELAPTAAGAGAALAAARAWLMLRVRGLDSKTRRRNR